MEGAKQKMKTAFNNFISQFVKTYEANKDKPSYWLQVIGSIFIIGLAVGSAFFGLKIDKSEVLMVFTIVGSVLTFVGTVTDNSILEHVGNDIKSNSDSLTKSEQDLLNKLVEAQKTLEESKKHVNESQPADKSPESASSSAPVTSQVSAGSEAPVTSQAPTDKD